MAAAAPVAHPPLHGARLAVAAVALSTATFMNVLDTTIANVSLPSIAGDLGVSPSQGTWVITSFAVANAIAVPLTGWATQRFGQLRLFIASVLAFVLASLACGFASTLEALIFFRVVQGFVAGPMIPLSQALLLAAFPREKAPTALAAWSMTTLVAPVAGPILGGWLTDNLSWPWIFWINVPVGLVAALFTARALAGRESATRRLPIDTVGLALLVLWVGALQLMLDKGQELDWFASPFIVGLALVAGIGFLVFLIWELTQRHPIVDLSLFARRNFSVGVITIACAYALFFGNVVLMPLWLQQYMGYTATWAGLVTAPTGVLALACTPLVARVMPYTDPRRLASFAFVVFAVVAFMRAGFTTGADVYTLALPQFVQGVAVSCFFVPLTALILSGLPPERIPAASGLSNFARITAGAIGASVFGTQWDDRAALHHAQLAEHLTPFSSSTAQALHGYARAGLDPQQALGALERQVGGQAHLLAANDLFWISGVIFVVLIGIVWIARPQGRGAAGDAAGAH
ncbi:DHA2 family multidrug resistance protein [Plasticicumulans lactativorans]|uniref:DHA2 family multidrug resistance protein n=1 Tax=Plasticicumulans lactativorans TaxID=1133106 RepID=A0A4R2KXB6_9GAMM|nr:DHA2 family efflux MFS transporter permease subunit [Plasticicumulans lactativorans]TCO79231.1 DHA2 family multidrug resistance protein [Plasticicumulans lactativorans]